MNEGARAAIVAEARSWIGTPYHHMGRVKGRRGGTDCAQFVYCVFHKLDLAPEMRLEHYPPDWHLHRGTERYLSAVAAEAHEVAEPLPGDVVLYRFGRAFAHGAIVVGWPDIVHALKDAGRVILDHGAGGVLGGRERRYFSVFGREEN